MPEYIIAHFIAYMLYVQLFGVIQQKPAYLLVYYFKRRSTLHLFLQCFYILFLILKSIFFYKFVGKKVLSIFSMTFLALLTSIII